MGPILSSYRNHDRDHRHYYASDHVHDSAALAQLNTIMMFYYGLGLPLVPPPRRRPPIVYTGPIEDDPTEEHDGYADRDYDGYGECDRFMADAPILTDVHEEYESVEDEESDAMNERDRLWPQMMSSDDSGVEDLSVLFLN